MAELPKRQGILVVAMCALCPRRDESGGAFHHLLSLDGFPTSDGRRHVYSDKTPILVRRV